MPTGHPLDLDLDEIRRLYASGLSLREVGEVMGCDQAVIRKRLMAMGVPRRNRGEGQKGKHRRPLLRTDWTCPRCGVVRSMAPSVARKKKFCSPRCAGAARVERGDVPQRRPRPTLTCLACHVEFEPDYPAQRRRFCSADCGRYYTHIHHHGTTMPELVVHAMLMGMGEPFETEKRIGPFFADVFLSARQAIVEIDGAYWHSLSEVKRAGLKKQTAMDAAGIPVLHITDTELREDLHDCYARIRTFIEHQRH